MVGIRWSHVLGAFAAGAALLTAIAASSSAETPPTPSGAAGIFSGGMIAPGGVSLVAFTGTAAQLNLAGAAVKAVSISATAGGRMLTFVVGAPDFVNADFNAAYPTGLNATPVIVKAVDVTSPIPPLHTVPAGWPTTLQLGSRDQAGGAAAMKATAPFAFRYVYLSGGVNTDQNWTTWNSGGTYVTRFIADSVANSIIPVFSFYQIRQSAPGNRMEEKAGVAANLEDAGTMAAYFDNLKFFFDLARAFPSSTVVLHVEPDMWGFIQQRSASDNGASVRVKVASSGVTDVAAFPDNAAGLARAIVKLRDQYAPNVILGYHMSTFGSPFDPYDNRNTDLTTDAAATRVANFYTSLGARFDITFAEFLDRDAAFYQEVRGDATKWNDVADFARRARYIRKFSSISQLRVILWQIPVGNTKMRAMDNTSGHYQDNIVEWFLDDPGRTHLQTYADAGVVAFLFHSCFSNVVLAQEGKEFGKKATCSFDAMNDGITNPNPINGNTLVSLNTDDDGGYFKQQVATYYAAGPMALNPFTPVP